MNNQTVSFPSNPFKDELFEPLEVRFTIGAPVMLSYPWIMFDALIAHAMLEQHYPDVLASLDSRVVVDLSRMPLPLEKHELGSNDFFYHASCSRFDVKATATANIRKRLCESDTSHVSGLKKIDIVRGQLKAYDMRMVTIIAPQCMFYCNGSKSALESLLANTTGLGKKRAAGFGRVIDVTVSRAGSDFSILHPVHGVNRPVPVAMAEKLALPRAAENVALLAYKPPYWDKSSHTLCRVPDGFGA